MSVLSLIPGFNLFDLINKSACMAKISLEKYSNFQYKSWKQMSDDMHLIKIKSGFFLCRSLIHKKSYLDDPEQIRTADLPLRRRTLYPAELQDHANKSAE